MGSDMNQKLKNVVQHLVKFEEAPKEIKGRLITDWFRAGERLFKEFHDLGVGAGWQAARVRGQPEVTDIVAKVTSNQDWLQSFITIYPNLRVDLEGAVPAVDVCRVRSGVEFLLRGFKGISSPFDKVLRNLEELGELEELDAQLRVWLNTGHRPEFFPGDVPANTPDSHWWWS
ncbi:hypothetical protein RR46_08012 [Papilio xuthus]|uniref:Uncharacterized protein n=1 Tax=Papilio xuthus TaxID=66420 RepID=A0A194QB44_PAPXU|nr:hypothetical protein RR46_08012 [Papilio xuthus]